MLFEWYIIADIIRRWIFTYLSHLTLEGLLNCIQCVSPSNWNYWLVCCDGSTQTCTQNLTSGLDMSLGWSFGVFFQIQIFYFLHVLKNACIWGLYLQQVEMGILLAVSQKRCQKRKSLLFLGKRPPHTPFPHSFLYKRDWLWGVRLPQTRATFL